MPAAESIHRCLSGIPSVIEGVTADLLNFNDRRAAIRVPPEFKHLQHV